MSLSGTRSPPELGWMSPSRAKNSSVSASDAKIRTVLRGSFASQRPTETATPPIAWATSRVSTFFGRCGRGRPVLAAPTLLRLRELERHGAGRALRRPALRRVGELQRHLQLAVLDEQRLRGLARLERHL